MNSSNWQFTYDHSDRVLRDTAWKHTAKKVIIQRIFITNISQRGCLKQAHHNNHPSLPCSLYLKEKEKEQAQEDDNEEKEKEEEQQQEKEQEQ